MKATKSLALGILAAAVLTFVLPSVAEARHRYRDSGFSLSFGYSSGYGHRDHYRGGGHYYRSERFSPRYHGHSHYDDCGPRYYSRSYSYHRPRYYDYDRCYDSPRYYRRSYSRYYCD
jgi:hypothetical protein